MLNAVIFDFDGTLVDTETCEFEARRSVFAEYGIELTMEDWQHVIGLATFEFDPLKPLADKLGDAFNRAATRARVSYEINRQVRQQPLMDGVEALMDTLIANNITIAVASNSIHSWVDNWLAYHGLLPKLATVVCRDDVERGKPHPDLYNLVAERIGFAPETMVSIEDSHTGVMSAKAAGLQSVAVPLPYITAHDYSAADLIITSIADLSLDTLNDLCA